MLQTITINTDDIIKQVKLDCQIPEIVEKIVIRKLVEDALVKAGVKISAEELQKVADHLRMIKQLHTAEETWIWLGKYSLSLDDFEEFAYVNFINEKLTQHLFADKVEPYFFERQLDYSGVVMYEVILDDEDLAMELFYAITEGEISFYEVARQYIQDTELRRSGGYRGIVRRKDLKPEISAAVYSANPPQVIKPIVTSVGIHLIFVEEIIQPELDDSLRAQILADLFAAWVKQQIEAVEIVTHFTSDTDAQDLS